MSSVQPLVWHTTRFQIDLGQPRVMGIVNVTPDSFSDGGQFYSLSSGMASALAHCEQLVKDGADILDIGGESSRPGAQPLPLAEELARVVPVVRQALTLGVAVSVDTYKPEVMQVVLDLGADIINDIWALRQAGACHLMPCRLGQVDLAKSDTALAELIDASDQVDHGGLASTVGPDQASDLAAGDLHVERRHCLKAAEALANPGKDKRTHRVTSVLVMAANTGLA